MLSFCYPFESVKCVIIQADFINKNKESVDLIFNAIKEKSEFQKSFVGFVHNAGGYRHSPEARPSIEMAQDRYYSKLDASWFPLTLNFPDTLSLHYFIQKRSFYGYLGL